MVRINKRIRTGGFPDDRKLHAGMTFFCACRKIEVANWISHRLLRRRNNSGAHAQNTLTPGHAAVGWCVDVNTFFVQMAATDWGRFPYVRKSLPEKRIGRPRTGNRFPLAARHHPATGTLGQICIRMQNPVHLGVRQEAEAAIFLAHRKFYFEMNFVRLDRANPRCCSGSRARELFARANKGYVMAI